MWDLRTIHKLNDASSEAYKKGWRGSVRVASVEDLDGWYAFPYYDSAIQRTVVFASNRDRIPSIKEPHLKEHLKTVLEDNGEFLLSMHSSSRYEVKLVLWFG